MRTFEIVLKMIEEPYIETLIPFEKYICEFRAVPKNDFFFEGGGGENVEK